MEAAFYLNVKLWCRFVFKDAEDKQHFIFWIECAQFLGRYWSLHKCLNTLKGQNDVFLLMEELSFCFCYCCDQGHIVQFGLIYHSMTGNEVKWYFLVLALVIIGDYQTILHFSQCGKLRVDVRASSGRRTDTTALWRYNLNYRHHNPRYTHTPCDSYSQMSISVFK